MTSLQKSISRADDAVGVFYEMVRKNLGVHKRVVCTVGDECDDVAYSTNIVDILTSLDIQHPVGQYIVETLQSHRAMYGSGGTSLLFMIGQLCREIQQLLAQGVPLMFVEELLNEAVEDCIIGVKAISVSVKLSSSPQKVKLPSASTLNEHETKTFHHMGICSTFGQNDSFQTCLELEPHASERTGMGWPTFNLISQIVKSSVGFENKFMQQTPDHSISTALDATLAEQNTRNRDGENKDLADSASTIKLVKQNKELTSKKYQGLFSDIQKGSEPIHGETGQIANSMNLQKNKEKQVTVSDSNNFLQNIKRPPTTSASSLHNVMLGSRHLQKWSMSTDDTADINFSKTDYATGLCSSCAPASSLLSEPRFEKGVACRVSVKDSKYNNAHALVDPIMKHRNKLEKSYCPTTGDNGHECGNDTNVVGIGDTGKMLSDIVQNFCMVGNTEEKIHSCHTNHSDECQTSSVSSVHVEADVERCVFLPEESETLSHGCTEMMVWAKKLVLNQLNLGQKSGFNPHLIHTYSMSSQHGDPQLVHGLVLPVNTVTMEVVSKMTHPLSVLLISGDLTANYRHRGYRKAMTSTSTVSHQSIFQQRVNSVDWHAQVLGIFKQLQVQAVLVRGSVDTDVRDQSAASGIAVIDMVPFRLLQAMQSACGSDFVTYVFDAHKGNVCKDIMLTPGVDSWSNNLSNQHHHLLITSPVFTQTLVILAPCSAERDLKEAEFWQCMERLTQAVENGSVLPGEAATECWCDHFLRQGLSSHCGDCILSYKRWSKELELYRPIVTSALADAFSAYVTSVRNNKHKAEGLATEISETFKSVTTLQDTDSATQAVYDNYSSKVNGWRTAVKCACTVVKMDSMITTGVERQMLPAHRIVL